MSQSPIPKQVSNCKGVILPYHPGFIYAALESSQEPSMMLLEFKPDFLSEPMETMDVSNRKVIYYIFFK